MVLQNCLIVSVGVVSVLVSVLCFSTQNTETHVEQVTPIFARLARRRVVSHHGVTLRGAWHHVATPRTGVSAGSAWCALASRFTVNTKTKY